MRLAVLSSVRTALCSTLVVACTLPVLAQTTPDFTPPETVPAPVLTSPPTIETKPAPKKPAAQIDRICDLIETSAQMHGLPKNYFARLIWKESRFDEKAVSPVGAQGIAQFMPATAKAVGLADPFDMTQAIPASAKHLAEMRRGYGNLGLATAAYNSGEGRVNRWLASGGGFLPIETEEYVLDIMGEDASNFIDRSHQGADRPLDKKLSFEEACRKLPIIMSRTVPMSRVKQKAWGVQVAGNFRRGAAMQQWQRVRARFASLRQYQPVVSRIRTPIGRRGIYAVRIGVDNRANADQICQQLRSVGGSCVVMRNR